MFNNILICAVVPGCVGFAGAVAPENKGAGTAASANEIVVDCQKASGTIRPLHGVNLGPLCDRGMLDLSQFHKELRIPITRLHDVVWFLGYGGEAVDVHTIFRDFRNDPNDERSYDFRATDDYIKSIRDVGSDIVYRLGESIEHTTRQYYTNPPEDKEKWAQVCLHIIRHYNEGWAGGYKYDIRYWEIWNEPDCKAMWTGSDTEFFSLFEIAAKAIKARFPELKVGGPAVMTAAGPWADKFLGQCRDRSVPLDFFSWHCYGANPYSVSKNADAVRTQLDRYGYTKTESHMNEWNYIPNGNWGPFKDEAGPVRDKWYADMGGPQGAAYVAAVLMLMQDTTIDVANFYSAGVSAFALFSAHGTPNKQFYAFKAFRALLDTPLRVAADAPAGGQFAACAGMSPDKKHVSVLVSNWGADIQSLPLTFSNLPAEGSWTAEILVVDSEHNLQNVRVEKMQGSHARITIPAKAGSVVLVKLIHE